MIIWLKVFIIHLDFEQHLHTAKYVDMMPHFIGWYTFSINDEFLYNIKNRIIINKLLESNGANDYRCVFGYLLGDSELPLAISYYKKANGRGLIKNW